MPSQLEASLDQAALPWFELSTELLSAIATHPAFPTEGANQTFEGEIHAIRAALQADPCPKQATITGVDVQEALTRYARHAEAALGGLTGQLREIADLLLTYAGNGDGVDPALEQLRQKVSMADEPATLQALRQEIIDRLDNTRLKTEERIRRGTELTEKLQDRVTVLEQYATAAPPLPSAERERGNEPTSTDPCTGLPDWKEARHAISRALQEKRDVSIAIFYVHRMNYINARFGSVIGDKIMFVCSQHLATALVSPGDALFRWRGPAFLAILEREESQAHTENDIQRLLATPLSQYLETPTRTVYLPIKLTGHTIPPTEPSLSAVEDWVDRYVLRASAESRLTD